MLLGSDPLEIPCQSTIYHSSTNLCLEAMTDLQLAHECSNLEPYIMLERQCVQEDASVGGNVIKLLFSPRGYNDVVSEVLLGQLDRISHKKKKNS